MDGRLAAEGGSWHGAAKWMPSSHAVDVRYARLDALRAQTAARLADVRRTGPSGSPQNRSERDAFATLYEDRLAQLDGVEQRLTFGGSTWSDGATRYIGRIGLTDDEHSSLLTDWRAPAAQAFYRATAAQPDGVVRRRHLVTRGRTSPPSRTRCSTSTGWTSATSPRCPGEGALLAALTAGRTGRMSDIVATIQAEQDAIIRAPMTGALVVQGGPGTGKTAVALHRAAYLLYAHRRTLERSGVLLLGPEPDLPALHRPGAALARRDRRGHRHRRRPAAGRGRRRRRSPTRWRGSRATRGWRPWSSPGGPPPASGCPPSRSRSASTGALLRVRPPTCARRSRVPGATASRTTWPGWPSSGRCSPGSPTSTPPPSTPALPPDERAEVIEDLRTTREVRIALNLAWMPLTPQQADRGPVGQAVAPRRGGTRPSARPSARCCAASRARRGPRPTCRCSTRPPSCSARTTRPPGPRRARRRGAARPGAGVRPPGDQRLGRRRRPGQRRAARRAVRGVRAPAVHRRAGRRGPHLDLRARRGRRGPGAVRDGVAHGAAAGPDPVADDRRRRRPDRGERRGAHSWAATLDPVLRELVAARRAHRQLPHPGRGRRAPRARWPRRPACRWARSPRHGTCAGSLRVRRRRPRWPRPSQRARAAVAALPDDGTGRVAVIAPPARLRRARRRAEGRARRPCCPRPGRSDLDATVALMAPRAAKGLEFDAVVLCDPTSLAPADLYVAMTRPTQSLDVVSARPAAGRARGLRRDAPAVIARRPPGRPAPARRRSPGPRSTRADVVGYISSPGSSTWSSPTTWASSCSTTAAGRAPVAGVEHPRPGPRSPGRAGRPPATARRRQPPAPPRTRRSRRRRPARAGHLVAGRPRDEHGRPLRGPVAAGWIRSRPTAGTSSVVADVDEVQAGRGLDLGHRLVDQAPARPPVRRRTAPRTARAGTGRSRPASRRPCAGRRRCPWRSPGRPGAPGRSRARAAAPRTPCRRPRP